MLRLWLCLLKLWLYLLKLWLHFLKLRLHLLKQRLPLLKLLSPNPGLTAILRLCFSGQRCFHASRSSRSRSLRRFPRRSHFLRLSLSFRGGRSLRRNTLRSCGCGLGKQRHAMPDLAREQRCVGVNSPGEKR